MLRLSVQLRPSGASPPPVRQGSAETCISACFIFMLFTVKRLVASASAAAVHFRSMVLSQREDEQPEMLAEPLSSETQRTEEHHPVYLCGGLYGE